MRFYLAQRGDETVRMNGIANGRKSPDMSGALRQRSIQISIGGILEIGGEIIEERINAKRMLSMSTPKDGTTIQFQDQDQDQGHGHDRDRDTSGAQKTASTVITLLLDRIIIKVTVSGNGKAKGEGTELGQTVEQARMMKDIGHTDSEVDLRVCETRRDLVGRGDA